MFGCKTAAGSPQLHQPGSRAQEETEGSWQVAYVIMILDDTTPAAAEALVLSQALQLPSKHLPVTHCRKPEDRVQQWLRAQCWTLDLRATGGKHKSKLQKIVSEKQQAYSAADNSTVKPIAQRW